MRQLKISNRITDRSTTSVEKYLQDVSRYEMVTPEEEVALAKRIEQGDQEALERLVQGNLRFVISVAKQYQNLGMTLSDLINEGNCGLIKAAQRFDATKGFKFISYAVWWIRQSILKALAEHSRVIRLPLNQIGSLNKINRTFSELEQVYEREPSANEIAKKLEMTEEKVSHTLRNSGKHVSMDAPMKDGEDFELKDILEDTKEPRTDQSTLSSSVQEEINRTLSTLSEREQEVIRLSFGLGMEHPASLEEIAFRFDMSKENVRRIKKRAIKKLRSGSRRSRLRSLLEEQ